MPPPRPNRTPIDFDVFRPRYCGTGPLQFVFDGVPVRPPYGLSPEPPGRDAQIVDQRLLGRARIGRASLFDRFGVEVGRGVSEGGGAWPAPRFALGSGRAFLLHGGR